MSTRQDEEKEEKVMRHILITVTETPETIAKLQRDIDNWMYMNSDVEYEVDISE